MRAFKITLCTKDPDHKVWWSNHVFVEGDVLDAIMKAIDIWLKQHNEVYAKKLQSTEITVATAELLAEGI